MRFCDAKSEVNYLSELSAERLRLHHFGIFDRNNFCVFGTMLGLTKFLHCVLLFLKKTHSANENSQSEF